MRTVWFQMNSLLHAERRERRGMEIEIEEAEKKRRGREDKDTKPRDR